jgi:hypothetical protein
VAEQRIPSFVVAYHARQADPGAELGEVVSGVRPPAGGYALHSLLQNQYRSLARDPSDFPVNIFIRHQVT